MQTCKNCFAPVEDLRVERKCVECSGALHTSCSIKLDDKHYCDICYTVKSEEGDKVEFEIPDKIRRTYIELYKSCPYKFYLEVIQDNPMPPNCYTQIGVDLHDLFEYAINNKDYTKEEMYTAYNKIWDNYSSTLFEDDAQKEKMWQRSVDSIDTFYHIKDEIEGKLFTTEENIQFSIGDDMPDVSITMDLIMENDGELDMYDWKTGRVMVGQKLSTDLQAPLYIYAVKQKFNMPVRSFTFYYLHENKERTFHRVDEFTYVCRVGKREYFINLRDAIREVKTYFSRIKKGDFNIPRDTRKMHFTCKMCHFKQDGTCKGAEEESWYQYNRKGW